MGRDHLSQWLNGAHRPRLLLIQNKVFRASISSTTGIISMMIDISRQEGREVVVPTVTEGYTVNDVNSKSGGPDLFQRSYTYITRNTSIAVHADVHT